jgi:hypothetical protein
MGLANVGGPGPFQAQTVGETVGRLELANCVPINVHRPIDSIETSEIVIVPFRAAWAGRLGERSLSRLVDWLHRIYERGAVLCSACSGIRSPEARQRTAARSRRLVIRGGNPGERSIESLQHLPVHEVRDQCALREPRIHRVAEVDAAVEARDALLVRGGTEAAIGPADAA